MTTQAADRAPAGHPDPSAAAARDRGRRPPRPPRGRDGEDGRLHDGRLQGPRRGLPVPPGIPGSKDLRYNIKVHACGWSQQLTENELIQVEGASGVG